MSPPILLAVAEDRQIVSETLRFLRHRFDQLASYEKQGEKLTTLRRLVLFGCFAIHVHMIRRCADVIPDGPRPPILLDMFDGRRRSLREASAATLEGGRRAIEQLVVFRIREYVASVLKDEDHIGPYLDTLPDTPDNHLIVDVYRAEHASMGAVDALAEAFWKAGYSGVGPKAAKGLPVERTAGTGPSQRLPVCPTTTGVAAERSTSATEPTPSSRRYSWRQSLLQGARSAVR